jgi:hypothetical protein
MVVGDWTPPVAHDARSASIANSTSKPFVITFVHMSETLMTAAAAMEDATPQRHGAAPAAPPGPCAARRVSFKVGPRCESSSPSADAAPRSAAVAGSARLGPSGNASAAGGARPRATRPARRASAS